MLVLGLASTANATLSLRLNGSDLGAEATIEVTDVVVIGIYDDQAGGYVDFLSYLDIGLIAEGGYALTSPRLGPYAGDAASINQYTYLGYDEFLITQADMATPDPDPGEYFLVDLECIKDLVDVQVILTLDGVGQVDSAIIHQVPEPMTIALLGLGGLLLRRRR